MKMYEDIPLQNHFYILLKGHVSIHKESADTHKVSQSVSQLFGEQVRQCMLTVVARTNGGTASCAELMPGCKSAF